MTSNATPQMPSISYSAHGVQLLYSLVVKRTCLLSAYQLLGAYIKLVYNYSLLSTYVTGYSKTDHNVTLGQLHFIGPANSHTHTLPIHCCINGLS